MRDYFYLALYKSFGFLLSLFSHKIKLKLIKGLAWFAYTFSKKHQRIIERNLDLAFEQKLKEDEKKKIGIDAFMNLIDTTFGIMERERMSASEVLKNVRFENEEIIQAYQREGKQFICITGHYGNWELLSQSLALHFDLKLVGVGRQLDSAKMDKVLIENRQRFGVEMIYKKGAMKGCIKAISEKKTLGILVDQHLPEKQSIDVNFFKHKVTHTPIASILSRKFGIDLIPVYISTTDYQNYVVKVHPPIKSLKTENQDEDLKNMTQAQATLLEEVIRQYPNQWFWQHKRWKGFYKEMYQRPTQT